MKSAPLKALLAGLLLVISSACTTPFPGVTLFSGTPDPITEQPFASEGLQLTGIKVPETFQSEIPYEILVNFESEGELPIRKVCLQWVREQTGMDRYPSVYCYAMETPERMGRERACSRWLTEGEYTRVSPLYCAVPMHVTYGKPGNFVVRISTSNVQSLYDRLDLYAEYVYKGKIRWSNQVSSPVILKSPTPDQVE